MIRTLQVLAYLCIILGTAFVGIWAYRAFVVIPAGDRAIDASRLKAAAENVEWRIDEFADPMTDAKRVAATGRGVASGKVVSLILYCQDGKSWAYLSAPEYLGVGKADIEIRAGTHAARRAKWEIDRSAVTGALPSGLFAEILSSDELIFRVSPQYTSAHISRHNTSRLREHSTILQRYC